MKYYNHLTTSKLELQSTPLQFCPLILSIEQGLHLRVGTFGFVVKVLGTVWALIYKGKEWVNPLLVLGKCYYNTALGFHNPLRTSSQPLLNFPFFLLNPPQLLHNTTSLPLLSLP